MSSLNFKTCVNRNVEYDT